MVERARDGGERHYELTADEIEQIGRMAGPTIREGMRKDLEEQTKEFRTIVLDHEKNDNVNFGKIDLRLGNGDTRMQSIETNVAALTKTAGKIAKIFAAIAFFLPAIAIVGWDLIKWYWLKIR